MCRQKQMIGQKKFSFLIPIAAILLLGVIYSPPSAFANTINCNGLFDSGEFDDDILVESGDVCELNSVKVNGNVEVTQGGSLTVFSTEVNGNVIATDATFVSVQRSAIKGDIQVSGTALFTVVAFNIIDGNVIIEGTHPESPNIDVSPSTSVSLVIDNEINGNIVFNNNFFAQSNPDGNIIGGNTLNGNLQCTGNTPSPNNRISGVNNVDGNKEGQCAGL